jgi:hypothetical protein
MTHCIYCSRAYNRSEFNREHVVPEQLGAFENTFILHGAVGDTIENSFGRQSLEAVLRLIHGQKNVAEMNRSPRFVRLSVPEPSLWAGAILEIAALPGKHVLTVTMPPQVGFRRKLALQMQYVAQSEIVRDERLLTDLTQGDEVRVVAAGEEAKRHLIELVRSRFSGFEERYSGRVTSDLALKGDQIVVQMQARIHSAFARAIAKIVFNYLTFRINTTFALNKSFDAIRRFIRYDEGPPQQFVRVTHSPLLGEETDTVAITRAHLLTLNWDGDRSLVGNLSPYNYLVYKVALTRFFDGIWVPIRFGNAFDWEIHRIQKMLSPQGLVLPDFRRAALAGEPLFGRDAIPRS